MSNKAKQEELPNMPPNSPVRAKLLEAAELHDRISQDKQRVGTIHSDISKILKEEKKKSITCQMEDGTMVTVSLISSKEKIKISKLKPLKTKTEKAKD